jgi:hypothetical protein
MSVRTSFRVRSPISGRWALVLLLAFLAFAYGRPFAWSIAVRAPAVVAAVCGLEATADLVLRSELAPPPDGSSHRKRIPEWFACRDSDGRITTDVDFHHRVVWGGSIALFVTLLGLAHVVRVLWRAVFGIRHDRDGTPLPSPAGRLWRALPPAMHLRAKALAFAAGVGFAISILPTAVALQNLHRVPGAAALICESGRLDPYGYGVRRPFGSSRASRQIACLDEHGDVIVDEARHERVAKTILFSSWAVLALLLYPVGIVIFRDGRWRR